MTDPDAVVREQVVAAPPTEVFRWFIDPDLLARWIGGLRSVRLVTEPPVGVGSQVERVASFLGRRIEYVNEITELTRTRLAMRSVRSPFPMRVTYGFDDAGNDATKVSVRVEGDASRLYRLADPLMALMVHRSVQRDLRTLKRLLENGAEPPASPG